MVESIGSKPVLSADRQVAPVSRAPAVAPPPREASEAAPQLSALATTQASAPPVDYERVARIRKAIHDGSFPIYPTQIADRLIALKIDWNFNTGVTEDRT